MRTEASQSARPRRAKAAICYMDGRVFPPRSPRLHRLELIAFYPTPCVLANHLYAMALSRSENALRQIHCVTTKCSAFCKSRQSLACCSRRAFMLSSCWAAVPLSNVQQYWKRTKGLARLLIEKACWSLKRLPEEGNRQCSSSRCALYARPQ